MGTFAFGEFHFDQPHAGYLRNTIIRNMDLSYRRIIHACSKAHQISKSA